MNQHDFILSPDGNIQIMHTPFEKGFIVYEFKEMLVDSRSLKWKYRGRQILESQYNSCVFRMLNKDNSLSVEVVNTSTTPVFLHNIIIKFLPESMLRPLNTMDWLEYVHPMHFGAVSVVKKVGAPGIRAEANAESSMIYLLCPRTRGKSILFFSVLPHRGDYIKINALHDSPHLEGVFGLQIKSEQEVLIKKSTAACITPIRCMSNMRPISLLEHAGRFYKKSINRKLPKPLMGWNSWDYLAGAVSANDMCSNMKKSVEHFGEKLKCYVIDEGYESRWGVWDANWKFPDGLKMFCNKVKEMGGKPGIWTAPTMMSTYCDTYRLHPEYFAKGIDGQIVQKLYSYGAMALLDITHPDVENNIYETFVRLKEYGFEYYKVDFTQEILNAKLFYDRSIPRGMIIRRVFETIRKAIGDSSYLLACGAPFESVVGVSDSCRISGDIHNFWGHVCANAANIAGRWWMNRNLWNNDPDFLIVRSPETWMLPRLNRAYSPRPYDMKNYWFAGRELNISEVKVYAMLIYMTAGDIFLSDDLSFLNRKGISLVKKILEKPLERTAIPYDMFTHHDTLPSIWISKSKNIKFVGFINWTEDPLNLVLSLKEIGIKIELKIMIESFWGDNRGTLDSDGNLKTKLSPRSCEGFYIITLDA